jgi:ABC-type amino acid transport substrate-binding protein
MVKLIMIMKYKAMILLGCLVALLATGCKPQDQQASGGVQQQENTFDHVQKTGVLRAGYFLMEPMIMRDKDGKLYGTFVDIVEQIAKDMRWKVEYKQVDLKNFAASLQAGEFDVSVGPTFSSPGRASGASFTSPIIYLGYTGVTTADKVNKFKTWDDLDQPGVRVAVKQGSAIGDYVTRVFKKAQIISLEQPALSAPLAAVPAQADVGLMNQITVFTFLRDNPQAGLKEILADNPLEFTGVCWAVKPGDSRWLEFLNTALKHYEDTGRVAEWEKPYKIPYLYHEKRFFQFDIGTDKKVIEK